MSQEKYDHMWSPFQEVYLEKRVGELISQALRREHERESSPMKKISQKTGIAPTTIRKWYTGKKPPSLRHFLMLAQNYPEILKVFLAVVGHGYTVHCVEPGKNLVELAKKKFADNPNITFEVSFFEESEPKEGAYDLAISATAFHWVPDEIGYPLTAKALKPNGTIALFWNMHPELDPQAYEALRNVYKQYVPDIHATVYKPDKKTAKEEAQGGESEINKSGLFAAVEIRHYNWSQEYTSEQYTKLLNTYANYQNLDRKTREAFFAKVREVINTQLNGKITNHYLALLYCAKKAL